MKIQVQILLKTTGALSGLAALLSVFLANIFPCCILLALSWNTTNENLSTDKLNSSCQVPCLVKQPC